MTCFFLKNGPIQASFSFIFGIFKQTIQFFTTNQCEKMSCPSSIRHWDSNPRPSERESPPITTRPGLPPYLWLVKLRCRRRRQWWRQRWRRRQWWRQRWQHRRQWWRQQRWRQRRGWGLLSEHLLFWPIFGFIRQKYSITFPFTLAL